MKYTLIQLVVLLFATPTFADSGQSPDQVMLSYWQAYSNNRLLDAAKYVAPDDLASLREAIVPVFLEASESDNESLRLVARLFFQPTVGAERKNVSPVQAWVGLCNVIHATSPKYAEGLPLTEITVTKVDYDSPIAARVHFELTSSGSPIGSTERAEKLGGRWFLRLKKDPQATGEKLRRGLFK